MGWKGTLRAIEAFQRRQQRDAQKRQRELERQNKEQAKLSAIEQARLEVETHENKLEVLLSVHREQGEIWDWVALAASLAPPCPMAEPQLQKVVADILNFRDTPPRSGLVTDFNQLSSLPGVNAGIMSTLKQECYLAPYTVKKTEMVGPKVGAELRNKAVLATLYALAGMLA